MLTDILNTNRTAESFSQSQKLFLEHCSRCSWYPTCILLLGQYILAPALQRLAATGSHFCNLLKRAVCACREPHGGRCLQRWEWRGIWLIDGGALTVQLLCLGRITSEMQFIPQRSQGDRFSARFSLSPAFARLLLLSCLLLSLFLNPVRDPIRVFF